MSRDLQIPKTVERRRTAVVSVSLPPVMVERLDEEAMRRYTTRTQVVRDMILRQLDQPAPAEVAAALETEPHRI